jgi:anti-anti-sigma factor
MDTFCLLTPGPPGCFRLTGELDISALSCIIETLDHLDPCGDLELDLSGLTFMDSAGVHVLVYVAALVEPTGRLRLVGPTRQVRRVLDLSGIAKSIRNIEIAPPSVWMGI